MQTKTIKLNKGEYTDFTTEFTEHDIIILSGARGSGKSFPAAKYVSSILEADPNAKFGYMRISRDELATFYTWCTDLNLHKIADNAQSVRLQRGKPTRGDITLFGYDNDNILIFERVIGKCISLESAHEYKSGKYDEFKVIVFEECSRLKMNPTNEQNYVFNFLEIVVSIFRDRPKNVIAICNNFRNIPLFDRTIDELTGIEQGFTNPIKIKIFRKGITALNSYMAYLNGEVYESDDFTVNIDEFYIIYTNKNYIIKQHKIYPRKHYITANKNARKIIYSQNEYLTLRNFCRASAVNEFYYQSPQIEKQFVSEYNKLLSEITKFLSDKGSYFIMQA